jgi:hypothetical protein
VAALHGSWVHNNLTAAALQMGLNEYIFFTHDAVCVNLNIKPLPVITDT